MNNIYQRYISSNMRSIYDAYNRPSENKIEAWNICKKMCRKYEGKDLKVISKNIYFFTAGFIGIIDGNRSFVYITAYKTVFMNLDDHNEGILYEV